MTKRKPVAGETIRVLPPFGDTYEAKVGALLGTMFTVYKRRSNTPIFLYYAPMKGETWEYVT